MGPPFPPPPHFYMIGRMKGTILDGHALNPGDLDWSVLTDKGDFTIFEGTSPDEVLERCSGCEVVITNKVAFDRKVIEALPQLRYIGVTATGYNIIDTQAAKEHGVAVTNIPAYSTNAVAQHVFAFLLELADGVGLHDASVKAGDWERSTAFCYWKRPLFELEGKRIGIVGAGNIGRRVASLARAFGMEVLYTSPHSRIEGARLVSFDELVASCPIISLHCPLSADTLHMVDDEALGRMGEGTILINCSRGPLVDSGAVLRALDSGRLSWYCADVLEVEPPRGDMLVHHPHTLITPHIAWAPLETRSRLLDIASDNLEAWLEGRQLNRIV